MLQLQSTFGVFALLGIAWVLSENRRAVSLRQAGIGLIVTLATAVILIKLPFVAHAFGVINDAVGAISAASRAGTSFVFGYLGGGTLPFDLKAPGADFILAFQALPIVLVMSVLTTLLFYWRILPPVVRGMAWVLEHTLGIGGDPGQPDHGAGGRWQAHRRYARGAPGLRRRPPGRTRPRPRRRQHYGCDRQGHDGRT